MTEPSATELLERIERLELTSSKTFTALVYAFICISELKGIAPRSKYYSLMLQTCNELIDDVFALQGIDAQKVKEEERDDA